ncbi:MAG: hypothetical protein KGJ60_04165 [Verrucomicrobiota bacterium]|nr:hypothetical protein [Verrucomicrobiota bacterium]
MAFSLLCGLAAGTYLSSAGAATLSGSFTPLPSGTNVNLTGAGALDWVHWGFESAWTVERKYGVTPQITNTFLAPFDLNSRSYYDGPFQLTNGLDTFTWSDGASLDRAATNTRTGVYIYGDQNKYSGNAPTGFQIQCPADITMKQLKIYVGTSGVNGTLTASLSGAASYTDNSLNGGPSNGVYTINFQADSAGQMLTVTFTSTNTSGYLALQAATSTGPDAPPSVSVTAPADASVFAAPATFSLTATASDSDGFITNLSLLDGATILGQTNSGSLGVSVSNLPGGAYNFVAVASDNGGLSITSFPARVFVTTGGGTLAGSVVAPPANLDLTAEGALDWVHWGLLSATNSDRKAGVTLLIPDVQVLNATTTDLLRYSDNLTSYSWTDGAPTASTSGTTTGIFLYSTNQPPAAFQLTVPATSTPRELKVYAGLYGDHARMDAWLSDWSAVSYSDESLSSAYGNGYAVYTFIYSSTNAGATLNVRWSPAIVLDPFYGNVTWQAATLSSPPAATVLTAPVVSPASGFDFSFFAETGVNYTVWYSGSLGPVNWQVLTNFPGVGGDATINDSSTNAARFYRVQAQ